jgi:hypothetical protein
MLALCVLCAAPVPSSATIDNSSRPRPRAKSFVVLWLIDADAPRFDDPQLSSKLVSGESDSESSHSSQ